MPSERYEVLEEAGGVLLDRFVREIKGGAPWSKVRAWIERGQVLLDGQVVRSPTLPLAFGSVVEIREHGARRAPAEKKPFDAKILFQDSQVVVVVKPTGVSTEPYDESEKDTLDRWLQAALGGQRRVHVVHRLDKETSGVLVFARTTSAKDHLKNQFRFHTTQRRYLALVHGTPRSRTITSQIVRDRGDGLRGSTDNAKLGRASVTHVEVLEELAGASLIECRLETGRTHQIRIHLAEAGHPLLGERVYSKGYAGPLLPAPRVMLHAETLAFDHPVRQERLRFQSDPPSDFTSRLEELRRHPAPRAGDLHADVRPPRARASVNQAEPRRAPSEARRGPRSVGHGKRKQFG